MTPFLSRVIYRMQEALMRRPTFEYAESLERTQWLPREEIERLQMKKLKALLQTASSHSPWHAEHILGAGLNLSPDAELTMDDLRKLPIMTRADARLHGGRMVWPGVPGGAHKYNTGGSSGQPLIFHFGRWRQASDAAGRIRGRRWWGVDVGAREVYLWGAPVELSKTDKIKTLRDRLVNQLLLNAFEMSPARMDSYLDAMEAWKPKCLYGYASSLALLAAHADQQSRRLRLPDLRVVVTTGEPVYPHQREIIEHVFGARVANEYGARDVGFIAQETPAGQMLLMSESNILEILDANGNPVVEGDAGEAVVTGLTSFAQPFVRYRTGDVLRGSSEPCSQGRGLHVVAQVIGRTTDFVVRRDGVIMHALAVIYVLRAVEGVAEFKLIQHTPDHMEVLVVPGPTWQEHSGQQISRGLRNRLGDVQIELKLLDAIPPEASGKHRYVVSHVPLGSGLDIAKAVTEEM